MNSNFNFLENDFPILAKLGYLAENYIYTDTNACLFKLGVLAEEIVNEMFILDSLKDPEDNTQVNKIKILKSEGLLQKRAESPLRSVMLGQICLKFFFRIRFSSSKVV